MEAMEEATVDMAEDMEATEEDMEDTEAGEYERQKHSIFWLLSL